MDCNDLECDATSLSADADKVVLFGASVRAAAESARGAGLEVFGIDCFGDEDAVSACDRFMRIDRYAQTVESPAVDPFDTEKRYSGCPLVCVGGLAADSELLNQLRTRHPVLGAEPDDRRSLATVQQLRSLAAAGGLAFPECIHEDGHRTASRSSLGDRWLWKPLNSSGGIAVQPIGSDPDRAKLLPTTGYLQRWVAGRSIGAVFLADDRDVQLLGACRSSFSRRSGRSHFAYAGSAGPLVLSECLRERLITFARCYAKRTGIRGLFNADLIIGTDNIVWLLEVNPRWSASCEVVEMQLQEDVDDPRESSLFYAHYKALTTRRAQPFPAFQQRVGGIAWFWKRIVYSTKSGRWNRGKLASLDRLPAGLTYRVADRPCHGSHIPKGEPIATLLVRIERGADFTLRTKRRLVASIRQAVC